MNEERQFFLHLLCRCEIGINVTRHYDNNRDDRNGNNKGCENNFLIAEKSKRHIRQIWTAENGENIHIYMNEYENIHIYICMYILVILFMEHVSVHVSIRSGTYIHMISNKSVYTPSCYKYIFVWNHHVFGHSMWAFVVCVCAWEPRNITEKGWGNRESTIRNGKIKSTNWKCFQINICIYLC